MNYSQILKTCPFFAGLSDVDIEALMGIARVRDSSRGELLFSDGEKAVGFFVVLDGKVKVYKLSGKDATRLGVDLKGSDQTLDTQSRVLFKFLAAALDSAGTQS